MTVGEPRGQRGTSNTAARQQLPDVKTNKHLSVSDLAAFRGEPADCYQLKRLLWPTWKCPQLQPYVHDGRVIHAVIYCPPLIWAGRITPEGKHEALESRFWNDTLFKKKSGYVLKNEIRVVLILGLLMSKDLWEHNLILLQHLLCIQLSLFHLVVISRKHHKITHNLLKTLRRAATERGKRLQRTRL